MVNFFRVLFLPVAILVMLLVNDGGALIAQDTTRIYLLNANTWKLERTGNLELQKLVGNVILRHDSTFLYCDSAYLNDDTKHVKAFGHVNIKVSDTLNIFGDTLYYNGTTRVARMLNNVRLVDNQTILTTDTLYYDRNTAIARYHTGGRIENGDNVLTSRHGYYYTDRKEFFFKDEVILRNPDYIMHSDTMKYHTVTEIAYFFGPSTVTGKDNYIYCEDGRYNTQVDISRISKNAVLWHKQQMLKGDSIYYEQQTGFGEAFRNVEAADTTQDIIIYGHYGRYVKQQGYTLMTDSAVALKLDGKDTLFLHADTLRSTFDTAQQTRQVMAYHKVKFFRHDLQGLCDSLIYRTADSALIMHYGPVLWAEKSQMTADSITLVIMNNKLDSMVLYNSAFMISKDDTLKFNQVKGRTMMGFFRNNDLYKINVFGNAETIYFVREEDRSLIGINKAISSDMLIFVEDNDIRSITYIGKPEATLYPEAELTPYDLVLRDFKWMENRKPLRKEDIFTWK
ncbi:MAG: organic solvent tolerance protein OstA [Bacteroidetes bacterium]|nr:organic solvent tolerance protein OstA [Bacteroidota bacterium]